MTAPRVLVSDKLSEAAVKIFRDRGIDVDYKPDLGKDKDALLEAIPNYDGLAIRSATKVTPKILAAASRLKVIGRAGIGVDNVDIPAASQRGVVVMNTPFGNAITTAEHAISMMMALARQITEANASTRAGTCLCHGVPANQSRSAPEVSSLGAAPGPAVAPASSATALRTGLLPESSVGAVLEAAYPTLNAMSPLRADPSVPRRVPPA